MKIGEVALEVLAETWCRIVIYRSGRAHKIWTSSMTALFDPGTDLEDPYLEYEVQNVVKNLRRKKNLSSRWICTLSDTKKNCLKYVKTFYRFSERCQYFVLFLFPCFICWKYWWPKKWELNGSSGENVNPAAKTPIMQLQINETLTIWTFIMC